MDTNTDHFTPLTLRVLGNYSKCNLFCIHTKAVSSAQSMGGVGEVGVEPSQSSLEPPYLTSMVIQWGGGGGGGGGGSYHASCLAKTYLAPVNTLPVSSGQTSIFIITSTLADL